MTNHPTGDTALSRAITTGAPVATNDKQAAELTQKWGEFTTRGGTVYRDDTSYAVCVNPRAATSIARRINAADAMEAENKRLRQLLELAAMMSDSKADTLKTWSKFQDAGYEQREDKRESFTEFLHREIAAALRGGA